MATDVPARTCPECGEPVRAGIVRHPPCYEQHQVHVYAFTERQWMLRNLRDTSLEDREGDKRGPDQ